MRFRTATLGCNPSQKYQDAVAGWIKQIVPGLPVHYLRHRSWAGDLKRVKSLAKVSKRLIYASAVFGDDI